MWKKGTSLEEEVSIDDFDASVFIDRVFTRTSGEMINSGLDVDKLKSNFELIINNLQILRTQVGNRVALMQHKCKTSERSFKGEIKSIMLHIEKIEEQFRNLESRIQVVSSKVYIGDQLERMSIPRYQLQEAKEIICEFYKYINGEVKHNLSESEEEIILRAADMIQRLSALCLELPDDSFQNAKDRVKIAHEEIDQHLTNRFKIEMMQGNTDSMRRIVNSLSFSKNFSIFISTFVEQSVNKINIHQDLIGNLVNICTEYNTLIESVFPNHNAVMLQLVQAIFTTPLKKNIETRIPSASGDLEQYLINVYSHYIKLDAVVKEISSKNLVQDNAALNKLFKELFRPYLVNYIQKELIWLKERLIIHISRYYQAIDHQKKVISEGSFAEMYRDFQARFTQSSTGNEDRDQSYNKLLLSLEVAVNILEDVKISLNRCKALSPPTEMSEDIEKIMDMLVTYLVHDYLNYGIYIALQGLMYGDNKREPNLIFFQVVQEANNIFQFFDKVVSDKILPLITSPSLHSECLNKRQQVLKELESKINQGLEKLLLNSISYIQNILSSEQKKTDFRPENGMATFSTSAAAEKVVGFLRKIPHDVETYLDGQNREVFSHQFGVQFHRVLMDHLYTYTYSCEGSYVVMQDVNMYDEVIRRFHNHFLDSLFNSLLTLINIFSMKPENLNSIIRNHLDNGIPRELLLNFINLRSDQKTARSLVADII